MKKKIVSILLCLCSFVSLFSVFAFAQTEDEQNKYIEQGYNYGFDQFIDVEQYVNYASSNEMQVVGIGKPVYFEETYESLEHSIGGFKITLYVYNPGLFSFDLDNSALLDGEYYPFGCVWYTGHSMGEFEVSVEPYLEHECIDDSDHVSSCFSDKMFFLATFRVYLEEIDDLQDFHIRRFDIGIGDVLDVDTHLNLSDIDDFINYSSALSDLSIFQSKQVWEVEDAYPVKESSTVTFDIAFFYESNYGTDDFGLFLYLYNPTLRSVNYVLVRIFDIEEQIYKNVMFDVVSHDGCIVKLKCYEPSKFNCTLGNERDYFIEIISINIDWNGTKLDNLNYYPEKLSGSYRFSSSDLDDVDPVTFMYMTSYSSECSFADDVSSYSFSVSSANLLDQYTKFNLGRNFEIIDQSYGLVNFTVSNDTLAFETDILFYTQFPLSSDLSISPIFKANSESGSSRINADDVIIDSSTVKYVSPLSSAVEVTDASSSTPHFLYMKANQDEKISLKLDYTYYRLDSSATDLDYYQTLSTLYFAIDESWLELDDVNIFNDRYVSRAEIKYDWAMTEPIIAAPRSGCKYIDLSEYVGKDLNALGLNIHTGSKLQTSGTGGSTFTVEYMIGADHYGSALYKQYFTVRNERNYFDRFNYYLEYDSLTDPGDMFVSTEDVTNMIGANKHLVGDFQNEHLVLNFCDTLTLSSFKDMSFDDQVEKFGFWNAFWYKICGTTQSIQDSIKNIECILTVKPSEIKTAIKLDDQAFSDKYYVSIKDVPEVKEKMQTALNNDQAFVFIRYDVFDYYSAYANGLNISDDDHVVLSQTKYYEDLSVISLELSNSYDSKIYAVSCEPITVAPGLTFPDPIDPDQIIDPINPDFYTDKNELWSGISELFDIAKIIISIMLVVFLLIILVNPASFIVKKIIELFRSIFGKKRE